MSNENSTLTKPALIDRVGEKVEAKLRPILRRIPPRASLLTGSVLVLVTLYLPLAVNSCGEPAGIGRDLVLGRRINDRFGLPDVARWPSIWGVIFPPAGRVLYIYLLSWAAFTLLLACSPVSHNAFSKAPIRRPLLAIAGAASLLVLADCSTVLIGIPGGVLGEDIADPGELWLVLLTAMACAFCLRAKSVRASLASFWLFVLGGSLELVAACIGAYWRLTSTGIQYEEKWTLYVCSLALLPTALYFLGPFLLWGRHGLWPLAGSGVNWPALRRRLGLIYGPAVAGQFWSALTAVGMGIWGLVPCLAGVYLITLGYMRLAQQADAAPTAVPAADISPAVANS